LTNSAIKLGEMVRLTPISCPPLGEPSRSPNRLVQDLAGARPCVNGVEDVSGEEIELQGRFCKSSVTMLNSDWARSQLVKTPRASAQVCQRGRARGRLSALAGLDSAQCCSIVFSFSFIPRAKTIIEKCRKMLKL
jgi:hypothetical protein